MKPERDLIERLVPPDEIVRPEDRIRSRSWLCSTCGTVVTAAEPVPIPAPCTKCGGISFETVESPLQERVPEVRPPLHPHHRQTETAWRRLAT